MRSKLILSNNMMAIIILALVLNLLFIVVNSFIIYYLYNLEDKKCNCNRDWRHDYIKYVSMFMIFNNILNLFSIELNIIKYLKGIIFILSIINIYAFYTYISELNNTECKCAVIKQKQLNNFLMIWRYLMVIIPITVLCSIIYLAYNEITLLKNKKNKNLVYNKTTKKYILKN